MTKIFRNLLLVAGTIVFALTAYASEDTGNDSGGGGNICLLPHRAVLLELSNIQLVEPIRGTQLKITPTMKFTGLDKIDNVLETEAGSSAFQMINAAENTAPKATALLRRTMRSLVFYATQFRPKNHLKADFQNYPNCRRENTVASIVYINDEVYISVPLFNILDLTSQSGLLIHEALRRIQITYGGKGSDFDLQEITRAIVLGQTQGLDAHPFFAPLLQNSKPLVKAWDNLCVSLQATRGYEQEASTICEFNIQSGANGKEAGNLLQAVANSARRKMQFALTPVQQDADYRIALEANRVLTLLDAGLFSMTSVFLVDAKQALESAYSVRFVEVVRRYVAHPKSFAVEQQKHVKRLAREVKSIIKEKLGSQ